jgi:hypothetical protein
MGNRSDRRNGPASHSRPAARIGGEVNSPAGRGPDPRRAPSRSPSVDQEPLAVEGEIPRPTGERPAAGREFYIDEFRVPVSLEAGVTADRLEQPPKRRRFDFGMISGGIVVAIVAAGVTVLLANRFLPLPASRASMQATEPANSAEQATAVGEPAPSPPLLAVAAAATLGVNEQAALNLSVQGPADGGRVIIKGLADGSAASAGRLLGAGVWRVDVSRVQDVKIRPPRGFIGAMDLVLELHLADDTLVDTRSVHLEWVSAKNVAALASAAGPTAAAESEPPDPHLRPQDRQVVASRIARGKELLKSGDFSSARLILQRAAEANDADAALALGATYDPNVLERFGIRGQVADVELARVWYERARKLGSTEAPLRLQRLMRAAR